MDNLVLDKKKNEKEFFEKQEKIVKDLIWKYPFEKLASIPTKTSVTKLKELEYEKNEEYEKLSHIKEILPEPLEEKDEGKENTIQSTLEKPRFLQEKSALTGAEIGTIMHLCMQKIDEKKDYTKEDLKIFVRELLEKGILTEKQEKGVSLELLEIYTKSELFNDLKLAKEIKKETPFYLRIPVEEIFEDNQENLKKSGETILVQGVIDLYYIDKNDKLILVDYKQIS